MEYTYLYARWTPKGIVISYATECQASGSCFNGSDFRKLIKHVINKEDNNWMYGKVYLKQLDKIKSKYDIFGEPVFYKKS